MEHQRKIGTWRRWRRRVAHAICCLPSANAQRLLQEINTYRDKLSSNMLELERREKEIEELNAELDAREADHGRELQSVAQEWKAELDEARAHKDELQQVGFLCT